MTREQKLERFLDAVIERAQNGVDHPRDSHQILVRLVADAVTLQNEEIEWPAPRHDMEREPAEPWARR